MNAMALVANTFLDALENPDLLALGMEADALRRKLHPGNTVTYTVTPHNGVLSHDGLCESCIPAPTSTRAAQAADTLAIAEETIANGGIDMVLHALRPGAGSSLADIEASLRRLRERYPQLAVHGLSAGDILTYSGQEGLSIEETLTRLRGAGLAALNAAGAAILNDDVRRNASGDLCSSADWLRVHRAAHVLGLPSFAAMIIGAGESYADRIAHLESLRNLQHDTDGFVAFALWVQHASTPAARREEEATAVDYLKTLAVSRLMLEAIPHLEADWTVQGPKVLDLALRFGADDAGTVAPRRGKGKEPSHHGGEGELRRIIRDAGFRPVTRDLLYHRSLLH